MCGGKALQGRWLEGGGGQDPAGGSGVGPWSPRDSRAQTQAPPLSPVAPVPPPGIYGRFRPEPTPAPPVRPFLLSSPKVNILASKK